VTLFPTDSLPRLKTTSASRMRIIIPILVTGLLGVAWGCQSPPRPSARAVVDSAIAAHGGPVLDRAVVSFDFRGDNYRLTHREGRFHYRRSFTDSLDHDVVEGLTNDGPYRVTDGDTTNLTEAEKATVETDVNSVAYFALLPAPLDDPAAQPEYRGRDTIDGRPYHRIKVTFRRDGGGQDWQDEFMYWFHKDTYAMDYLAYAYGLGPDDEETGTRFREAYNVRRRHGVRMSDYRNYTVDTLASDRLHRYPDLRAQNALELVSHIALDSIRVRPLSASS